jgi:hypothetical protein
MYVQILLKCCTYLPDLPMRTYEPALATFNLHQLCLAVVCALVILVLQYYSAKIHWH